MKRAISFVLSLIMVVGICTSLPFAKIEVSAVEGSDLFTVKTSGFEDGKITYTVYINAGVSLISAIIYAKFDSEVLSISSENTDMCITSTSSGETYLWEKGFMLGYDNQYSIVNILGSETDYTVGCSNEPYMNFSFTALDENCFETSVEFYCYEFSSVSAPENNIPNGSHSLIASLTACYPHSYSEIEVVDFEPTCTEPGSKSKHCTSCGNKTDITEIPALGHDYSTEWTIDKSATCTEEGSKSHHCSRCDSKSEITTIELIGHSYGDWNIISQPTCIETGLQNKTCLNCDDIVTETIAPLGHDYSTEWTIDKSATCTEEGSKSHHCSRCDSKSEITTIELIGHGYGDWNIISQPTCIETGLQNKTCLNCDDIVTETIAPLGHDYSTEWTIDKSATCTEEGSKSHHCTKCDSKINITTIPITEHNYSDLITEIPATCTSVGKGVKICADCGDMVYEIIPATGHHSSDWIIDKNANVYRAGEKYKECTECGEVLETAEIPQLKCSKPTLKSIENTQYGVLTKWGKVKGVDKYYVYRKTSGSSYSRIGSTTNTYYTDKTAKSGKKYYYIVKAINEAGASSSSSVLSKLYLADPTLKSPTSTKSGVSLKWTKSAGAEGYIIYRKTGSGSYTKLKTEKGVSNLSYVDKSAKKGKKYTYKIKAYKSKTYSAYSNTKTITDKY